MDTSRCVIRDHQWAKMEPHRLGLKTHPGRTGEICRRFRDWARSAIFERMFNCLPDPLDREMAMIDGTIVKVHRAGQGAKGGLSVRL